MRFLPEGPSIPNSLLEERDRGGVVFFCGAGVSLSAGMPTFSGLAKDVVRTLGVPTAAPSRSLLESLDKSSPHQAALPTLDQVFHLLQQEYGAEEIDYQVAKRLWPKPGVSLRAHDTVLRLSRSAEGNPQIVTTNFDRLFEKAMNAPLRRFVPPALPDLAHGQSFNGLVYLHGRANGRIRRGDGRQGFVVSSSDFGRAYLAEGWATRFVRDLLDRFTVVLLGYSANDPPVRYLLQGLHSRHQGHQRPIFAFDHGTPDEVGHRWHDSGITALPYVKTDDEHSALWHTLYAWAERADDPSVWRQRIVDLAKVGPRELSREQRGQVVSVVSTDSGAKLFSDANPPPPGEWLCVFDSNRRYANVGTSYDESTPDFDPFAEYGLDDDPPRSAASFAWKPARNDGRGVDPLRNESPESFGGVSVGLAGVDLEQLNPHSSRLAHIARWVGRVAGEPTVTWWAAQQATLHKSVTNQIKYRVEHDSDDLVETAKHAWFLLLEKFQYPSKNEFDALWYDTTRRIEADGWTPSIFRTFARATQPYLVTNVPSGIHCSKPPEKDWSEIDLKEIVDFEVKFPPQERAVRLNIPDEALPGVYRILRGHLESAVGLLSDIDTKWWPTKTFYSEHPSRNDYPVDEASQFLFWFRSILDRLIELEPDLIRHDCSSWPEDERFFFDKLRLYLFANPDLVGREAVANRLLTISNESFWETATRRELLMLLKARWNDFSDAERTAIETRVSDGDDGIEGNDVEDTARRRAVESARMLGWLQLQGCTLTDTTCQRLEGLRKADPRWNPTWDQDAASSHEGVSGTVLTDPDPACIIDLPLDRIIPVARENSRDPWDELVQYRPFDGLVAQRPVKAVSALTHASRQADYPLRFWRSVIQNWPNDAPMRLPRLFAERLARLPQEIVFELGVPLFKWAEQRLRVLAQSDSEGALNILDRLLEKLLGHWPEETDGDAEEMNEDGVTVEDSWSTSDRAINSPIGSAVELLLGILEDQKPAKDSRIPATIRTMLEKLVNHPGEPCNHAVCLITRNINWLNHVDSAWVTEVVLPWFSLEELRTESAWNGLMHANDLPGPRLFEQIKRDFLDVVVKASRWRWRNHDRKRLHDRLVHACYLRRRSEAYVSYLEAKGALQGTDEAGRVHCLWVLTSMVIDGRDWKGFVKPFLLQAWPRELEYRTESTSRQFVRMAEASKNLFPEVVEAVLPNLTRVPRLGLRLHRPVTTEGGGELNIPTKFPSHTLRILDALVPDDPGVAPFELTAILEAIAGAEPALRQNQKWLRLSRIAG